MTIPNYDTCIEGGYQKRPQGQTILFTVYATDGLQITSDPLTVCVMDRDAEWVKAEKALHHFLSSNPKYINQAINDGLDVVLFEDNKPHTIHLIKAKYELICSAV